MNQLPIESVLPDITSALQNRNELVLEAAPGAGKTTRVPLALLSETWLKNQQIIMLEPRRVAARAAAERMAEMLNEPVGETVGYRIRHENKTSSKTKIIVVTEGVLTRWIQQDPSLDGIALVIFDEFHERNLDSDLGLAFCLQARELFREDEPLKILIMSATLDGTAVAKLLNDAPVVRSEGRSFPVDIHHTAGLKNRKNISSDITQAVLSALNERSGNILVFLPGKAEIEQVRIKLKSNVEKDVAILPLHGSLKLDDQRAAILPLNKEGHFNRKIVLATDIAETSLTIEGIHTVIDSGLVRVAEYDARTATTRLNTKRISLASAAQRAGRAGRLGPGCAIRLWRKQDESQFEKYSTPEILNTDLSGFTLQLFNWGETQPDALKLLDTPKKGAYEQSVSLLTSLGALEEHKHRHASLTKHGRTMSQLPVHPRIAHMLIRGAELGFKTEAIQIAAVLSERNSIKNDGSDFLLRLNRAFDSASTPPHIKNWKANIARQEKQLHRLTSKLLSQKASSEYDYLDRIALLLAYAFPDRIACRLENGAGFNTAYKLSNGRQAALKQDDVLQNSRWLVVAEIGGFTESDYDQIYSAHRLDKHLFETALKPLISTNKSVVWDTQKNRFIGEEKYTIGKLTLKKEPLTNIKPEQKHTAIIRYIASTNLQALNWDKKSRSLQNRVELIRRYTLEGNQTTTNEWPNFSERALIDTLESWLGPFIARVSTLSDIKKLSVFDMLFAQISWQQKTELETLAPERYTVASGSSVALDYTNDVPVLAVKLQEMFGCSESPRILNNTLCVSVHLLSPAGRPLQITQDLSGFWKNSYNEVKKEMKGRYPKHPWPDDPTTALATRFTKKRADAERKLKK